MCSICCSNFVPGDGRKFHNANCHTYCCDDCVRDVLTHSVNNGQVSQINCPSCGVHLTTQEVARWLEPADCERFHRFLLKKMLTHFPNLQECGNPGCENAVIVDDSEGCGKLNDWVCEACAATCPWCKQEAHPRRKCPAQRKFARSEAKQKLWTAFSLSKRCPGCKVPIIKKGGCPHMTCKNPACGHQWCWHCKKDWSKHEMCVFEKLAIAGVIVVSPVLVGAAAAAAVVLAAPMMAASGLCGPEVFDGKALVRKGWKYAKRLYNEVF